MKSQHVEDEFLFYSLNTDQVLGIISMARLPAVMRVLCNRWAQFDVLLTVHLSVFISVINQLDAQNFCFTSLFHASTCFAHMCSKHVEA